MAIGQHTHELRKTLEPTPEIVAAARAYQAAVRAYEALLRRAGFDWMSGGPAAMRAKAEALRTLNKAIPAGIDRYVVDGRAYYRRKVGKGGLELVERRVK